MSVLNNKSGINRLFPFAKKKPNIPSKLSDKVDSNTNKQKAIEEKNCPNIKSSEPRCDILTENNDKAKPEEKTCSKEIPKKVLSETKKILLKNDDPETITKNKKSVSRKSSTVSDAGSIGIKKPKENYQRWNIPFSSKFKGKDFDKTLLTMQDLIYYNPVSNPIIKEVKIETKQEDDPDDDLLPKIEIDQKPSFSNNCITPCIKVGVDGKIIIDQETLTLNETGLEEKREELAKAKVIEESAFNSRSYSYRRKKEPSKQWSKNETLRFYKCLMNLGTDFSMVQQYFPGRTRAQIKRKYKTEEKKNPDLINGALTNTTHYDSVLLENMFQEDELKVVEETKDQAKSKVNAKPSNRKRRHKDVVRSDCSRLSVCAYMMEEEVVLKKKSNKTRGKIGTASNLNEDVKTLQAVKDKKNNCTLESTEKVTLLPIKDEKIDEPVPKKVRRLQDFHDEYEENITKYEEDSNSE